MKRDKAASNGIDADSVLKKHLSAAQRKKRKRMITIIAVSVIVVVTLAIVVISLRESVSEKYSSDSSVESTEVSVGSISTTISGSGTLTDDDVENAEIPTTVDIDEVCVEEGDTVEEGDMIATVDTATVISAMADIQEQLDEIDAELEDVSDETVDNYIKAGISGRVKNIYAEKGDDIATVMYENGALMLLSLDGLMAADIETTADISDGDAVTVTLSDGSTLAGTVEKVKNGVATVTVTDNGTELGDTVTALDEGGNALGTGTLYIHSELKVTGYARTVSKVNVTENKNVSASKKLFNLTDTSYTANYDSLLKERASLEEDLDELVKLYKEGAIFSPISGVIYSVDYDEDSESSASSAADTAATDTAAATNGAATSGAAAAVTTESTETTTASEASDGHTLIATVCPNATMSVTVDMDESDILSLEEGQEASVTIDSIGDDEFTGAVTEVNTSGTSSSGVTVFTVEVTIDKTEQMLAGMSATVDIKIEGVDNALLIPEDAINQTSSSAYVYTEYNEETAELGGMIEVTTGLSNGTEVEITSGLSEGDTVYYDSSEAEESSGMGGMGGMSGMPGSNSQGGNGFPSGQQNGGMPNGMPGGQ